MSYKYGLNGNDLNWDSMMFLKSFCDDLEMAVFNGDVKLDEDGYVSDSDYEGYMDSNPTIIYYKSDDDLDIQQILNDGKKIDDYIDWYIIHDTNGNFVYTVGDVPEEYFTEEYLTEKAEAEGV